jgi:cytochrome c556
MRVIGLLSIVFLSIAGASTAQAPQPAPPVGTMSDLMVSMVYPAANDVLLGAYRGGPKDDKEWAAIQRSAVVLAEAGNVLMMPARARGGEWNQDAKLLTDAAAAAYKAARAKDAAALGAVAESLNTSCITCHKQYRPNVHPTAARP